MCICLKAILSKFKRLEISQTRLGTFIQKQETWKTESIWKCTKHTSKQLEGQREKYNEKLQIF